MYAFQFYSNIRANVVFKGLRFTQHAAAAMKPRANAYQPSAPDPKTPSTSHKQKETKIPTDDVDAITQSIQKVSIKNTPDRRWGGRRRIPPEETSKWEKGRKMDGFERAPRLPRDAITPPSKSSGGIPTPTKTYIATSLLPLQPLTQPQHLLVVIDLNGTLLFRPHKRNPSKFIARPNTVRFLRYCIDTFTVVIWSSARPENVKLMCNQILEKDLRDKVVDIWGRDRFGLTQTDYNMRTMCYKRLTSLWDDPKIAASHPGYQFGERWNQTNTVLVDDSPEKGRAEPYNLIAIPEFFGDEYEQGQILPQVHDYLNNLSLHSNVAAYLRAHPFTATLPIDAPPVRSESVGKWHHPIQIG